MAEKRMFSMKIIDSDSFLDLPMSSQCLYFHLSMRCDDEGFLNNAKKIMKIVGANQNDYDLLKAKAFIIEFPDGICVIKHWRINNYIRGDRFHPTAYTEERSKLMIKPNGAYTLDPSLARLPDDNHMSTIGIPSDGQMSTENRIDKNRVEESRVERTREDADMEKYWNQTWNTYPNKRNVAMAKQCWMDMFTGVPEGNLKYVAAEIYYGMTMYLVDYKQNNSDDSEFKYLKSFDRYLKEDCMYWMQEYVKRKREQDGVQDCTD